MLGAKNKKGKGKKVKKKKSKGKSKGSQKFTKGKGSQNVAKGKGSQEDNKSPSLSLSPSPINSGKGKYGHGYVYCPELTSAPSGADLTHFPSMLPTFSRKVSNQTPNPSNKPSSEPTAKPKVSKPTPNPSPKPTSEPTASPTFKLSSVPSVMPTFIDPTPSPTNKPTLEQGIYRYDNGDCPADGPLGVPCAEGTNIRKICNRYHELGSFAECWKICEPAFCCIHDADPQQNFIAPSCSKDSNCAQYAYCYIVWFKFHDTFGPATYLNVEQKGSDFFDVPNSEVRSDRPQNGFFSQLYFHHFNDVVEIINRGRDSDGTFRLSNVFENPENWDTNV